MIAPARVVKQSDGALLRGAGRGTSSVRDSLGILVIRVPSDGVDRDTGGESAHLLKMSLRSRETF